jgi:hypothetical protein
MKDRDGERAAQTERAGMAAQSNSDGMAQVGKALVEAASKSAQSLDKASDALAKASEQMVVAASKVADNVTAQAMKAPRRLIRDPKTGRATGSEVIE